MCNGYIDNSKNASPIRDTMVILMSSNLMQNEIIPKWNNDLFKYDNLYLLYLLIANKYIGININFVNWRIILRCSTAPD